MNKIKQNKAITLIALIITIIVLLILAGVAITQLTGNGLLNKTNYAKEEYLNKKLIEEANIAIGEAQILMFSDKFSRNINLAEYIKDKQNINTSGGVISYNNNKYYFENKDGKKIEIIKDSNDNLIIGEAIIKFKITVCESEENQNVLKVIYSEEGELVNISENITLTKEGYVLIGWKRADNLNKVVQEINMPGHDVTIYPVWQLGEDYKVLLALAGIPNPESYSEDQAYSNANIMKTVMENEDAVNYMIKNTGNMKTKVLNNTVSASALGESTLAKQKAHEDANWLATINSNTYQYKYLTSSIVPKMDSANLNADGKSATKNGVTVRVSDYQNADTNIIRTIDKDLSSLWLTQSGSYGTHYYTIELPNAVCVTSYYYNR